MRTLVARFIRHAYQQTQPQEFVAGRRAFIKSSAMALAMTSPLISCLSPSKKNRVAIIGGGIAGMTASYHLDKAGITNTVYEAQGRVGGRILTVQDAVVDGAHVDFGAEFIDSTQEALLSLVKEFNIELVDLLQDTTIPKAYYFEGKLRTEKDVVEAIQPFADQLAKDSNRLPDDLHYEKANEFKDLDDHSVTSYLKSIGMDGWLLHFFEMAMESEYGLNANGQSAVNLLMMFSLPFEYQEHYHLLGTEHEVKKFKGGTQRLIDALFARVEKNVQLNQRLKKITQTKSGYELTFNQGEKEKTVEADYVVLAMPHSVLRNVERNFKFTDLKEKWLAEAPMGNAVKVALGFKERTWRKAGFSGYTFNDNTGTVFWDSSMMVDIPEGSLTFDSGGTIGTALASKSYDELREMLLNPADNIYPGLKDAHNNRIAKFVWETNPYSKGSYTCYKPGQWSAFAGIEAAPHGNLFFAGEHCSVAFQGFMNGAIETGIDAAKGITDLIVKES